VFYSGVVDVTLPDGTRIRGSSIRERSNDDSVRDFGLYMDPRWNPTWPADLIEWADFGLPADSARAASQIRDAFLRARRGESVEVGCLGGLGRTGTVLACMTVLAGLDPTAAIAWVREHYRAEAIETTDQERWVGWFGDWASGPAYESE
jgi:Swiss Army Knife protein, DSP-PTPase phosphatase domain